MRTTVYSGPPISVCVEASLEACMEHDLDCFEGEQFDWIRNCISIESDGNHTRFETTRSIEALKAGEPNAGRKVLTIENRLLERIVPKKEDQHG